MERLRHRPSSELAADNGSELGHASTTHSSSQGQIDGYQDSVNKVSGAIGTALSRFQIAAHVASSIADASKDAEARITDVDVADNSPRSSGSRSSSKRQRRCLHRRTNNPRWFFTLLR